MKSYYYVERSGDTLSIDDIMYLLAIQGDLRPIMWAQDGRYGWISKEQVQNMQRRQMDLAKQQKGYAKDKPIDLVFHWDDVTPLDPTTVRLMRETS